MNARVITMGRVLDILTGETGETRDCSEKLVRLRSTAKNVKFSWYCRVQQTDFLRFRLQRKNNDNKYNKNTDAFCIQGSSTMSSELQARAPQALNRGQDLSNIWPFLRIIRPNNVE